MTRDEWQAEGERRFGPDLITWRFVCPVCGHVATPRDWQEAGAPQTAVAFSCVGRWSLRNRPALGGSGPGPCDYAGGGLFRLNPVEVEGAGKFFAFAEVAATAAWVGLADAN